MSHLDILCKVADEVGLSPKKVDNIIEKYFLAVATATQKDLEDKREDLEDKNLLTTSAKIINKNVATFWTKYNRGDDGENALGETEKALYPRLKVRFSDSFYKNAYKDPNA